MASPMKGMKRTARQVATVAPENIDFKAVKRVCMMKPMKESNCETVHLKIGKVIVGRSRETGIRDMFCSKKQLELDVNLDDACIEMKVIGTNPSCVNGLKIAPDMVCNLQHGDIVEMIYGRYPFEVVFNPCPSVKKISNGKGTADDGTWSFVLNGKVVIYTSAGVRASEKVAGYDIDGTIIRTKSGNVFPKHVDDWQLNYPDNVITKKLKNLHENGYKICFFTNQAGIASGKVLLTDFKRKIKDILRQLSVPVQVYIAVDDGYYRKPRPGMWEHMQKENNDGISLILNKCFFVGDAAGRPEVGSGANKRRKDHSLADRLFATNLGIPFYTPEEHFLNNRLEQWTRPDYIPSEIFTESVDIPLLEPTDSKLPADETEMIILVGLPGSGKSHFTQYHLSPCGYVIANADTLGSIKACVTTCERALAAGKSCVVDNTNVDVESRKKFLEVARKLNVPCRCFEMNIPLGHVKHNIVYRELSDTKHSKINDMVFNGMKKRYKSPTLGEGFTAIVKVNFKPNFACKENESLYKIHLREK